MAMDGLLAHLRKYFLRTNSYTKTNESIKYPSSHINTGYNLSDSIADTDKRGSIPYAIHMFHHHIVWSAIT
jgi:hypothetical protein